MAKEYLCIRTCTIEIAPGRIARIEEGHSVWADKPPNKHFREKVPGASNEDLRVQADVDEIEELRNKIKKAGGTYQDKWKKTRLKQELFLLNRDNVSEKEPKAEITTI